MFTLLRRYVHISPSLCGAQQIDLIYQKNGSTIYLLLMHFYLRKWQAWFLIWGLAGRGGNCQKQSTCCLQSKRCIVYRNFRKEIEPVLPLSRCSKWKPEKVVGTIGNGQRIQLFLGKMINKFGALSLVYPKMNAVKISRNFENSVEDFAEQKSDCALKFFSSGS